MSTNGWLGEIRGWVFDVDGCLIRTKHAGGRGGSAMPGGPELLRELEDAGHRVVVCTNASEYAPSFYADHLRQLGFPLRDEDFVTAGSGTADHIHAHHPGARVLVIGGDGLRAPLAALGADVIGPHDGLADVVAVGAAGTYTATELNAGALAVDAGAAFYATVDAPWFSGGIGRSLAASSAIAASIAWATGRQPTVGGKPSSVLAESLSAHLGTPPAQTAVVGDALVETRLAQAMGAASVLVLSGATARAELASLDSAALPDLVLDDVAALRQQLRQQLRQEAAATPPFSP